MASKAGKSVKSQSPTHSNTSMASPARKAGRNKDKPKGEDKNTLAFKVLSSADTKTLLTIVDVDELELKVAEIFKITNHHTDLKDGALLDYYVAGLWWSKDQGFSTEQISAFFTVIYNALENIKEKQMPILENIKEFRKHLAGIGQENAVTTGGLCPVFDVNQAKVITQYLYSSLLQHYRLYTFMFEHTQAEEIVGTDVMVEVPIAADLPWPPPLEEAISLEVYDNYVAEKPPPEDDEEMGREEADNGEQRTPAEGEEVGEDGKQPDGDTADLLASLTAEEIKAVMDSVCEQTLGGLKADVAARLREKENAFINRINKIHLVADKT